MGFLESVRDTPRRVRERAFRRRSVAELMSLERSGGEGGRQEVAMKKELTAFDTILFGIGGIIGAGVFVITGVAAQRHAGPAVILSFLVSALSALLSAFCYSEFSVEMPVAGGAFSYLMVTFGEFPAFITVANLLLEYMLSAAAVARGFTSYFSTLIGQDPQKLRFSVGNADLDLVAVVLILLLTALLCYGTKDSSSFNMVVTLLNVAVVVFIAIAGYSQGKIENVTRDFAPFGARGVFDAAALVFFSYIGFDAVATLAEEVKDPARDLPVGIVGSVVICTVLYVLMCLALTMMVPYQEININAPFSVAFEHVAGWGWAKYVVAFGAVTGLVTSLLVSLMAQARVLLVMARANLIPPAMARISERTGTPAASTAVLGVLTAAIACVTALSTLANMVSIGTLFIFYMVAAALIFKRYHVLGSGQSPRKVLLHLGAITAAAFGLALTYQISNSPVGPVIFALLWAAATLSLQVQCPMVGTIPAFAAPLMPWLASASMVINMFLLATLDGDSYVRFLVWSLFATLVYVLYGVHAASDGSGDLAGAAGAPKHRASDGGAGHMGYIRMEKFPSTSEREEPVRLGSST